VTVESDGEPALLRDRKCCARGCSRRRTVRSRTTRVSRPCAPTIHGIAIKVSTVCIRLDFFTARRNARIASGVLATAIPFVSPSVRHTHTPVLCQNDGT